MSVYQHVCNGCCREVRTPHDWCNAVQELIDPVAVAPIVPHIKRLWKTQGGSTGKAVAAWMAAEIQAERLRYVGDDPRRDVWTAPSEVLRRGFGDCDDFGLLAASLFRAMRRTVDLAVGHHCRETGCIGHAWVEGHDEKGWLHLEATTGVLTRMRPSGYTPFVLLRPGKCLVIPDPFKGG